MAAVEAGDASPISEALKKDPSKGEEKEEIAAFAISTQGLSPLAAGFGGSEGLRGVLGQFLFEESLQSRARAGRLQEALLGSVTELRAAGVEVVALKGAALAFFHYSDPSLRPMGDLDLLLKEPSDLARATDALVRGGWRRLFDTPRHRVFARPDERVARPASEDPDNPIRLEIHTSFRLPVLGRVYDASAQLRAQAEARDLDGVSIAIAARPAFLTHLLFHAAEDFAGNGIRGIQAHDFRLLAARSGKLVPEISSNEKEHAGAAPLLFAADAVERLFPGSFEGMFLESLASRVSVAMRARAAGLPPLRYTRPARGWTRTLLSLIDAPVPFARFLLRTLFPTLGEVRANAAPDASGLALARAWWRVLGRRLAAASRWSTR